MTIKVSKPSINLREALSDLKQDTGIKGQELMRADTVAEARTLIGAGRKNLIINGGFDVWQRGTSFVGPNYTADRWYTWDAANTVTSVTDGLRLEGPSDGSTLVEQRIENSSKFLAGKTVTLSVTVSGTPSNALFYMYTRTGETGGSWQNQNTGQTLVSGKNTVTWNVPTGSGILMVRIASNGGGLVDVTVSNVQLELGSVATDFEHRSYGEELALCQRYYYSELQEAGGYNGVHIGEAINTARIAEGGTFPVTMRISPDMTVYTAGTSETSGKVVIYNSINVPLGSNYYAANPSINGWRFVMTSSTGGLTAGNYYCYKVTADAEL